MFECLILGDSIAVGTAREINAHVAFRCEVVAIERATASQILSWRKPNRFYGAAVLAVGSNDEPGTALLNKLSDLRRSISSRRVIWLLPYSRARAYLVNSVAISFGDESVDLSRFSTRDQIHTSRYRDVADTLLKRRPS